MCHIVCEPYLRDTEQFITIYKKGNLKVNHTFKRVDKETIKLDEANAITNHMNYITKNNN